MSPDWAEIVPEMGPKENDFVITKHQWGAFYGTDLDQPAKADLLATQLTAIGIKPVWPVEANLVFAVLPHGLDAKLRAAGASYYVRSSDSLDVGAGNVLVRLVTCFATTDEDVVRFVELCKEF